MNTPQGSPGPAAGDSSGGAGEAASRLTQDTAALVRQEIEKVREELTATAKRAGMGAGLLAGAGLCGVLSLTTAHSTLLRALEAGMPRARAAALLTAVYAMSASGLAALACDRLRKAGFSSREAADSMRQDLPPA